MRYQTTEAVRVAQTFLTGKTVTVEVLNLATDALETLTSASAGESTQIDGLYIWSTANLQTQPTSYTEFMVVFTESSTGAQKMSKIALGGYTDSIDLDLSSLNDLSIADVQTALTNQGYTTVRAALLDNLDQALTTTETNILAAVSALNDISVADILAGSLTSGDTVDDALSRLDNIDVDIVAMWALIKGGRDIDFTGNDALGWQRIERDTIGVEVARYNLFDQDDNRITGTVAQFFADQKMIAKEVLL